MSRNGLLVLIGLLAAALAGLVWLSRTPEAPGADAAPASLLSSFTEEALSEIDVACTDAAFVLRRDSAGGWRIGRTDEAEAEADPRRVHALVASLMDARVKKVIAGATAHLEDYGLAPAACTVRLGLGPQTPALALRLGRSSPVGSERYAEAGDARVVLTDASVHTAVAREAQFFRENRLIPVEAGAITRIVLDRPGERLTLARAGEGWRIESPQPGDASPSACLELARVLTAIELTGPGDVAAPARTRPDRRVRLQVSTGDGKPECVAFVASAGIGGKRLAWREGALRAGLIDESAAQELVRPASAFLAGP